MRFKISLAGDLGSGKSTVSKIIMARTGAEYYSTGTICRAEAERHGMTIDEFNRYMETHPEVDKMIDDSLIALSDDPRTLIIDSRMAFHFVRGTFRVYLTTDPLVSAKRILGDKRTGESFDTVEETAKRVAARRESENYRYFEKYGVHIMDMQNYDCIIDTTAITPEDVADLILRSLEIWQEHGGVRFCELDFRRFWTKVAVTPAMRREAKQSIKRCQGYFFPEVRELNGVYYVESGVESILCDYYLKCLTVACKLLPGEPEHPEDYQPMFQEKDLL